MKNTITALIVTGVIIAGAFMLTSPSDESQTAETESRLTKTAFAATKATVYKSPTCGCCEGHAKAMEGAGIEVKMIDTVDLVAVKDEHNIPLEMQACHTTILTQGDKEYVVEGHVPIEGIEALLEQRPDVAGITLPGMPSGTPGMPGPKTGPYEIMTLEESPELFLSL